MQFANAVGRGGTVEFATVGKDDEGKVYHHLWSGEEIMSLLKEHGLAKDAEEEG